MSKDLSNAPARQAPVHPNNIKQALHLAGRGLRVFPLIENGDSPVFDEPYNRASSDPAVIKAWFDGPYRNCNVAVSTGEGVIVFDADVKKGGKGLQSLAQMEMEGFDPSFTVSTRSGGRHAYCLYDAATFGDIPGSVRALKGFPDVDVRCHHNYVIAPGSVINGKKYEIIDDVPVAPAPSWMVKLAKEAKVIRSKADSTPLIELDTEPSIQRSIMYLRDDAPSAQEGAGGSDMTYMIAARLKDYGVSESMCFELMDAHWNEQKAFPMWMPEELETVIGNAYRYGTSSPGVRSALAEFDAVEIAEPANDNGRKNSRLAILDFREAITKALANPSPHLIRNVLDQYTFAVLYGPSNSAKTFLALLISYHIAAGIPWDGHKVAQGAVAYIAAEGGNGILKRVMALDQHFAPEKDPPLGIIPHPIDLLHDDVDAKQIIKLARDYASSKGQPLRLIVVDTLSRALSGGDENSSVDMGKFISNIDRLRSAADCTLLIVHHTGKNVANGARGWSGLRAAIDTEIEVEDTQHIKFEKQRDDKKIAPKAFTLKILSLGHAPDGDEITSCVLEVSNAPEMTRVQIEVAPEALAYLDILSRLVAETGGPVAGKEWDAEYEASRRLSNQQAVTGGSRSRIRKTLIESGWVKPVSRTTFTTIPAELETAA